MKDPALELQVQETNLLMSELKSFRDIVISTINTEVVVPDNEAKLNRLKETVPQTAKKLYSDLCEDYDATAEGIIGMVPDLSRLIKFTDLEKRKLIDSWHRYYMKLYFILGMLKSRAEKLDELNLVGLKMRKFTFSPVTIAIILMALIFLVFILMSQ